MPEVDVKIGGRPFTVACQDGEEEFLQSAAAMLDREAQVLAEAGGRLTQDRMLLMAGLMLADKAISAEEELRSMDRRLSEQSRMLEELRNRPPPEPERVEIEVLRDVEREVVPDGVMERVDSLAASVRAVADAAERLAAERA
jgi:cell division protein ZapA